jgi:hypothetical protein
MSQIFSEIGKEEKLCVRKVSFFDDGLEKFSHTPKGRDAFALLSRRKPSPCGRMVSASLLISKQNRHRLNHFMPEERA